MSDYTPSGNPISLSRGIAKVVRDEFTLIQTSVNSKADLASPALTGTPTAPTATPGTNNTQIATTAYADAGIALKADLASPALTGTPTAPTATPGTNNTQIATTAYTDAGLALKASLASPALTGTPTAPTAAGGTNNTQIATTAFVVATAVGGTVPVGGSDAGKLFGNDGATATWGTKFNTTVVDFADGTDATKVLTMDLSGISTGTTRTLTIPNATTTMVGTGVSQTLTNKTLTLPVITVSDASFTMQDNSDSTKKAAFQLSSISTSTIRTFTLPNTNTTLVGTGASQTITNKTITSSSMTVSDASFTLQDNADATKEAVFQLSGITTGNSRVISIPDGDTTIVGTGLTQTLTNKTLTTPIITVADNAFTMQDNASPTKKAVFQLSGITAGNTRTITLPDFDITLDTPGWSLLSVTTASGTASQDIEWTNGTYDHFVILAEDMSLVSGVNDRFVLRMKVGGTYLSTNVYNSSVFGGLIGSAESSFNGTAQSTAFLTSATIQTTSQKTRMKLYIDQPGTSLMQIISGNAQFTSIVPSPASSRFNVSCGTAGIMTGVQIRTQLGSNLSGTFRLYGIRSTL